MKEITKGALRNFINSFFKKRFGFEPGVYFRAETLLCIPLNYATTITVKEGVLKTKLSNGHNKQAELFLVDTYRNALYEIKYFIDGTIKGIEDEKN